MERGSIYDCPAYQISEQLNAMLTSEHRVVLTAPTGAGKSTLLPYTILKGLNPEGKILMLEPRRIAARKVAERIAWWMGEEVGETVGYRIRGEKMVSERTRIEVVTEGILTRMLVHDPTAQGISIIIFDEFHERNIHSDTALAMALHTQQVLRDDMRILVMSATLQSEELCQWLGAKSITAQGRMFDVETRHLCVEVSDAIVKALRETESDILVFLPGEREIRELYARLGEGDQNTVVRPLYSSLPKQEQNLALEPERDSRRKIILSTNIAETSLTIPGIRCVIDSGLHRRAIYDQRTGLSRLETERISLDMADQRRGRAGRVENGVCYRLWSQTEQLTMSKSRRAEIETADLLPLVLDIAMWGELPVSEMQWLTPPSEQRVLQARELLSALGALDCAGKITPRGRSMQQLGYHPRLARMILWARENGMERDARRLAEEIEQNRMQNLAQRMMLTHYEGALLAHAYPERIEVLKDGSLEVALMATQHSASVSCPVKREDVMDLVQERDVIQWNNKLQRTLCEHQKRIGGSVIESRELSRESSVRERIAAEICRAAAKYGTSMLNFNEKTSNLQARVATAAQWHPELEFPDLSTEHILSIADRWLEPFIQGAETTAELKKIDLCEALISMLSWEQQQALERIAPQSVSVASGSRIQLQYRTSAQVPVLRVRLQECLGMRSTPKVDNGTRNILMELLSPGFKPVQLTSDLESFWRGTYFEVRKELKRRYPKHYWPEDPLEAQAVRGVKKETR